jgi:hypothetical protein
LSRKRVVVLARQATLAFGNKTLESILGLLQSLKFGLRSVSWARMGGGVVRGVGVSRLGPQEDKLLPSISCSNIACLKNLSPQPRHTVPKHVTNTCPNACSISDWLQPTVNVGDVTEYTEVVYPSRRMYSRLGRVVELVYL